MKSKSGWKPRMARMLVVAPVTPYTWAVAFSRQLIPGAVFNSRAAAVVYAFVLASAIGLNNANVRVLGGA